MPPREKRSVPADNRPRRALEALARYERWTSIEILPKELLPPDRLPTVAELEASLSSFNPSIPLHESTPGDRLDRWTLSLTGKILKHHWAGPQPVSALLFPAALKPFIDNLFSPSPLSPPRTHFVETLFFRPPQSSPGERGDIFRDLSADISFAVVIYVSDERSNLFAHRVRALAGCAMSPCQAAWTEVFYDMGALSPDGKEKSPRAEGMVREAERRYTFPKHPEKQELQLAEFEKSMWGKMKTEWGRLAKYSVKAQIARMYTGTQAKDIEEKDVYLCQTGRSAVYAALLAVRKVVDRAVVIEFGEINPITHELFTHLLPGFRVRTIPGCDLAAAERAEEICACNVANAAIFVELPTHSTMQTPHLEALRELATEHKALLIVFDHTLTADLRAYADMVVLNLNNLSIPKDEERGGAIVLNPSSGYYERLAEHQDAVRKDGEALFVIEVQTIERLLPSFFPRRHISCYNADRLARFLSECLPEATGKVHCPNGEQWHMVADHRFPGFAHNVFVIEFCDPEKAKRFFERLVVCKSLLPTGPKTKVWMGVNDGEERRVRVQVGLEDVCYLAARFYEALGEESGKEAVWKFIEENMRDEVAIERWPQGWMMKEAMRGHRERKDWKAGYGDKKKEEEDRG